MSNKKKTLLTESEIRRFMKLSGNKGLTDSFLKRLNEGLDEEKEEPMEESLSLGEDDEMPPAPTGPETSEVPMEPEGDEPTDEATVEKLVSAIADAIKGVTGVQVTVDGGAEMPPPGDMGDESEASMPPADSAPPAESPGEEEEEKLDEAPLAEGKDSTYTDSKGTADHKMKKTELPKKIDAHGLKQTSPTSGGSKRQFEQPDSHGLKVPMLSESFVKEVAKRVSNRLVKLMKENKGKKPVKK